MKRAIILSLILIWTRTSIGQESYGTNTLKEQRAQTEIGINIYSITGNFYPYSYRATYNQNFIVGLMYKQHFNKNAIRIGFDYYDSKFRIEVDDTYYYYKNEGQNKIGEIRLGFERKLTTTKLQPFLATDLTLTYGQIKGITVSLGDIIWEYTEKPYDLRIKEIGIAPTFGLKYRLGHKMAITIEANVSLAYYHHRNLKNSDIEKEIRFYFNPLRLLSLSYQF